MDLSKLPAELVETVAEYLSVEDVLACSGVNSQWRSAFDNNRIWKRFCTYHPEYFQKQEPLVTNISEYIFEGCLSKRNWFKEQLVRRNLAQSKLHVEEINIGKFYCDNLLDFVDDAGNHWLFVSCSHNFDFEGCHQLIVWNMNKKPILHNSIETVLGKIRRLLDTKMKIIKDKFYYIVSHTVLVYNFSHPTYQLTFLYKVNIPFEIFSGGLSQMVCISDMILGFFYTPAHSVKSLPPSVHVWDKDGSLKIKKYSLTLQEHSFVWRGSPHLIAVDSAPDNVLLVYICPDFKDYFTAVLFNMKSFQYTEIFACYGRFKCCDIVNNIFVLAYKSSNIEVRDNNLIIKCFDTHAQCLYSTEVEATIHNFEIFLVNAGKEIVTLSNNGTITVFDVFQQKVTLTFKTGSMRQVGLIGSILNDNFIVIQYHRKLSVIHEVWNYKLGKKLYDMDKFYPFGYTKHMFSYSLLKDYNSPPKMIAIKDPQIEYAHNFTNDQIVVFSFW